MPSYATIADLRDEGVTVTQADDTRLQALIDEASALIDQVTGWVFAPVSEVVRLVTRRRRVATLWPPLPPIELTAVVDDGTAVEVADLIIKGAPSRRRPVPQIRKLCGKWSSGRVVEITGTWGYTEPDPGGDPHGRTPRGIRRATMLLVLRHLAQLAEVDEAEASRGHWRITEQRTRDQSYKAQAREPGALTGDPEVDEILAGYMPPAAMGAV